MLTQELLRRLSELENSARRRSQTGEPQRLLGFQRQSPAKERRINELWNQLNGELADAEVDELYGLLEQSIIYEEVKGETKDSIDAFNNDDNDDYKHTYVRVLNSPDELVLIITFHQFARIYPAIAKPYFMYAAEHYPLKAVRRLFEKYGWVTGQPDCSTILPLHEWAPSDRWILVNLYSR